jgi:putative FmdB family regulatory protein
MPIYEMRCLSCGHKFETIAAVNDRTKDCPVCSWGLAIRVPAVRGPNCSNDSASWIKSVLEVVDKESNKPHVLEFLNNPTRANYRAWMKGEGIRPLETGERTRRPELDPIKHAEKVMQLRQERNRITIL